MNFDLSRSTLLAASGVTPDSAAGRAAKGRENIVEMTQRAEDAVLRPADFGGFPHAMRAALAARICRLNAEETLAGHYLAAVSDRPLQALADPASDGAAAGLGPVVAFMDKVAAHTRDVVADDVLDLQAAGISDADIVRLCELNAFLGYQIRVVQGMRLMAGAVA